MIVSRAMLERANSKIHVLRSTAWDNVLGETLITFETSAVLSEPTQCRNLQGEGKNGEGKYIRNVENTVSNYSAYQLKINLLTSWEANRFCS